MYIITQIFDQYSKQGTLAMENMPKLKVGVIGTGALGRHHARLYAQSPNAEMIGIFDVQQDAAKKVGAEFGLPVFDKWEELAAQCDALSVAVPANYHASTTIPLLEMGKHVLVEKPIAASVDDARAMCEAAAKNQLVLGVGHVERFNPAMDYLETHLDKPRFIEARRLAAYPPARPGMHRRGTEVSVILDLMVHDLDLVLHLANSEVESFEVSGSPILSDSEDLVSARIKFVNGCCANVTASRVSSTPVSRLQMYQNDKCYDMDFGQITGSTVTSREKSGLVTAEVTLEAKNALAAELEDFIAAVQQTRISGRLHDTRVPGIQGYNALKLAVAIENEVRRSNKQYGFELPPWSPDELA